MKFQVLGSSPDLLRYVMFLFFCNKERVSVHRLLLV